MSAPDVGTRLADTADLAWWLIGFLAPWLIAYHWTSFVQWRRWQMRREKWWKWLHE